MRKPRTAKSKVVTGNAVVRAYSKAVKRILREPNIVSSAVSAGFIIPPGQVLGKETGLQVFVQVALYSAARLRKVKGSGGLFIYGNR